jgi:NAD(P)-dependent dehydrogenase (short-subunit alcohol dehydrogenase family)
LTTTHSGRIVVLTGGSAGIGRACVEAFCAAGAVVASLDRNQATNLPAGAQGYQVDVTDDAAVTTVIDTIAAEHGQIDVLVNNAGVSGVGTIETGGLDEWNRLWDINVLGYVRTIRAALPHLRRSAAASIVNMSSCTATSGFRQRSAYSATKGAIEALTRSSAADLIAEGITVNAVNPGTVDTPFMAELASRADDPAQQRRLYEERQPTGRMVAPAEVAAAVLYLADPVNRSSVGTVVTIDGGIASLHITKA